MTLDQTALFGFSELFSTDDLSIARSQLIDAPADELIQNSALPRIEDSDKSVAFEKATLAIDESHISALNSNEKMSVSGVSATTIFDGAKGAALDDIRQKKKDLRAYFNETVDAWKKASLLTRSAENYDEREKCDEDVSTVISRTIRLSIDAVKAATGSDSLDDTVGAMKLLRAKTYKALSKCPPLRQPEDDLAPPSQERVDIWREAAAKLGPEVDWVPGGDDIALGGDAAATAVNAAVNGTKPPKTTLGQIAGVVST